MANVTIREAQPNDAEAVAGLLGQLGYAAPVDAVARRIERHRASSADSLLVALHRGRVVGLAALHVSIALEYDGDAAKLSAIVVDAGHRRRGVGESLVAAVEAEARARGCVLLFLTTAERRKDAHAFYRRLGFEETGRRFAKALAM
ncbi:MAG: GNAT family N-acetyltransferase [Actinomycetota bacterium]|nr:GNAT family N-acetyltransferase [Actinomycetota bacterium]